MATGRPHPRSLANLRPPFAAGNQVGKHNNPWLKRANELREDIWKAATPEFRAAMAKQLCDLAIGRGEEPVFDDDGNQEVNPDGTWKFRPLSGERRATMMRWANDTILSALGGSLSFSSIDSTLTVDMPDPGERLERARARLEEAGLSELLPPALRLTKGPSEGDRSA